MHGSRAHSTQTNDREAHDVIFNYAYILQATDSQSESDSHQCAVHRQRTKHENGLFHNYYACTLMTHHYI